MTPQTQVGPGDACDVAPALNTEMKGHPMSEVASIAPTDFPQHWIDRRSAPTRGETATGSWVDISKDERLPTLIRLFQEDACEHPQTIIIQRVDTAGRPFFSRYCKHCGVKFGGPIPRVKAEAEGVAPTSESEIELDAERYTAERQAQFDKLVNAAVERAERAAKEALEEWRQGYDDYLRSPQWKRRAAKIMERAAGVCEGCLTRPAEEVHHLTYANVREEFAFELVALCSPCHRRVHGSKAA
jgi:hypothetical protein